MPQVPKLLDDSESWEAWFGKEVRNWRMVRGLSTRELGAAAHVSSTTVERIEKAERSCSRQLAVAIDERLDAGGAVVRLWDRMKEHRSARHRHADSSESASSHEPRRQGAGPRGALSPRRAQFDAPDEIVAQTLALTEPSGHSALVATATLAVDSVVQRYERLGPHRLAPEVRVLRNALHGALEGPQPPRVRSDLFLHTARTAGLIGYMAVNASAPLDVSQAYCAEAEALAREVGDTGTEMWVYGTRSLGLYYAGRYAEAARAAQAGVDLSPENPQAIRLLVNGCARAYARMGDRAAAEAAIGRALALSERQQELPVGLTACIDFVPYSLARTLANAITARLSSGDTEAVLADADEIEDLVERSDSEWSRALVRMDVASALLRRKRRDVEQAMSLGVSALNTGGTPPIRSVWKRARELYEQALRWRREAPVREYAEVLRTWQSHPQTRLVADRRVP
ncbi:helix-turn-helix domain-containing protein [Streptomyces sp. NPDC048172]|uniref:helix-turn-helix domain-containing protein n=1 Tax=Streptomyces sp. NPDC048172 TaxID=3365505 RepID=UPI00372024E7